MQLRWRDYFGVALRADRVRTGTGAALPTAFVREPVYKSKPKYCLLVFGREAKTRIWLVLDGDVLYVDRNGNGDLTEEGERVEPAKYLPPNAEKELPEGYRIFQVGDITELDGKTTHTDVRVGVGDDVRVVAQIKNGQYKQYAFFRGKLAERPQDAAVRHFNGPLRMLKNTPVLFRGETPIDFQVMIGTLGHPAEDLLDAALLDHIKGIPTNVGGRAGSSRSFLGGPSPACRRA